MYVFILELIAKLVPEFVVRGFRRLWHKPVCPKHGQYDCVARDASGYVVVMSSSWVMVVRDEQYRLHVRGRTRRGFACGTVECIDTEIEVGHWSWQPSRENPNWVEVTCTLENGQTICVTCRAARRDANCDPSPCSEA